MTPTAGLIRMALTRAWAALPPAAALLAVVLFIAGCATTDQRVTVHYEAGVRSQAGSGELHLAKAVLSPPPDDRAGGWVLGDIVSGEQSRLGRIVADTPPAELVMQAITAELRRAGYSVVPVTTLPGDVAKGISLSSVGISLREASTPARADARGDVQISIALWRGGKLIATLNYASGYTDTATTGRDRLLSDTLERALLFVMRQAIPETVELLERK